MAMNRVLTRFGRLHTFRVDLLQMEARGVSMAELYHRLVFWWGVPGDAPDPVTGRPRELDDAQAYRWYTDYQKHGFPARWFPAGCILHVLSDMLQASPWEGERPKGLHGLDDATMGAALGDLGVNLRRGGQIVRQSPFVDPEDPTSFEQQWQVEERQEQSGRRRAYAPQALSLVFRDRATHESLAALVAGFQQDPLLILFSCNLLSTEVAGREMLRLWHVYVGRQTPLALAHPTAFWSQDWMQAVAPIYVAIYDRIPQETEAGYLDLRILQASMARMILQRRTTGRCLPEAFGGPRILAAALNVEMHPDAWRRCYED